MTCDWFASGKTTTLLSLLNAIHISKYGRHYHNIFRQAFSSLTAAARQCG